MDSGDPVWTVLFVLTAVVIVILFVRMVKKHLCDAGSLLRRVSPFRGKEWRVLPL